MRGIAAFAWFLNSICRAIQLPGSLDILSWRSGKGPYQIAVHMGIRDPAMDPTRDTTYEFLDRFSARWPRLFPDAYFHIGGDECNGKEWDASPRIQAFIREHNLMTRRRSRPISPPSAEVGHET